MTDLSLQDDHTAPTILNASDPDWWRGAVIYQIYPRSFQDSNDDGIGDLKGILQRIDYIADLGVDAIWLSPFFTSPMKDFGYDVADFENIDPMFGTLADFDLLIDAARTRGLKVLIDLVISHSSDQHPWFVESRSSKDNIRADWYVWADAKPDGSPPNNWLSLFGGSAWEWDATRRQYYLHNFLASQPDLNFHNPDVQNAVLSAARFWLDRGVSGFRLDTVNFYFHDRELRDNPPHIGGVEPTTVKADNPYALQNHLYDKSQPENLEFLERLRALMDEYPGTTSVGEIGDDGRAIELTNAYTEVGKRLHMAYSFDLLTPHHSSSYIRHTLQKMEEGLGSGWPSWALSNHDVVRVVSRWGENHPPEDFAPLALALLVSLRGTACLYQGEELGLPEAEVPFEQLQDPYGIRFWPKFKGRDGCRTPMPWSSSAPNAGFSNASPWLPLPTSHLEQSVEAQSGQDQSVLEKTRRFLQWRKAHPALAKGDFSLLDSPDGTVVFTRSMDKETLLCAFNLTSTTINIDLSGLNANNVSAPGFTASWSGGVLHLPGLQACFAKVE